MPVLYGNRRKHLFATVVNLTEATKSTSDLHLGHVASLFLFASRVDFELACWRQGLTPFVLTEQLAVPPRVNGHQSQRVQRLCETRAPCTARQSAPGRRSIQRRPIEWQRRVQIFSRSIDREGAWLHDRACMVQYSSSIQYVAGFAHDDAACLSRFPRGGPGRPLGRQKRRIMPGVCWSIRFPSSSPAWKRHE